LSKEIQGENIQVSLYSNICWITYFTHWSSPIYVVTMASFVKMMELPKEVTVAVELEVSHIKTELIMNNINKQIQEKRVLLPKVMKKIQELEQQLRWSVAVMKKGHLCVQSVVTHYVQRLQNLIDYEERKPFFYQRWGELSHLRALLAKAQNFEDRRSADEIKHLRLMAEEVCQCNNLIKTFKEYQKGLTYLAKSIYSNEWQFTKLKHIFVSRKKNILQSFSPEDPLTIVEDLKMKQQKEEAYNWALASHTTLLDDIKTLEKQSIKLTINQNYLRNVQEQVTRRLRKCQQVTQHNQHVLQVHILKWTKALGSLHHFQGDSFNGLVFYLYV